MPRLVWSHGVGGAGWVLALKLYQAVSELM